MINIKQGDCLDLMKEIPDKGVDMILCDLPYGTTACKWDSRLPLDVLWGGYLRIIKPNGAIVLFCKQPFTTELIHSNLNLFKYTLVWQKDNHDNPLMAKKRFLNITEDIAIFYQKQCTYNPQMRKGKPQLKNTGGHQATITSLHISHIFQKYIIRLHY